MEAIHKKLETLKGERIGVLLASGGPPVRGKLVGFADGLWTIDTGQRGAGAPAKPLCFPPEYVVGIYPPEGGIQAGQ